MIATSMDRTGMKQLSLDQQVASSLPGDHPHRYRRRLAKGLEGVLQLLVNDVGVDLCGGQVGMT